MMLLDGAIRNTSLPLMAKGLGVTPLALTSGVTASLLAAAAAIAASGDRLASSHSPDSIVSYF